MAKKQLKAEKTIQEILEIFKWEYLSSPNNYKRISEALIKRMRKTKIDNVISLWKKLVSGGLI
jgi:division protein CdvB (Snf7/Vps24/ESCRT-III family)